jgi:RimJ/RimL family protein N-acetyltransferase
MKRKIPSETIDTLAPSVFKEASGYGFGQLDIVRLINVLMALCTDVGLSAKTPEEEEVRPDLGAFTGSPIELPLVGERITIRSFDNVRDKRLLEQWLPDKYGRYFLLSCATAQSITIDALTGSDDNHLGIITLLDGTPIGAMAFLDHSQKQKRAELRKLIGDTASRGRGLAEEATKLWIKYGVRKLDLEKIYVSTLQTQISNIKLNESMGFRVEGLLRNEVTIDGSRHDVLRMGLCIGAP